MLQAFVYRYNLFRGARFVSTSEVFSEPPRFVEPRLLVYPEAMTVVLAVFDSRRSMGRSTWLVDCTTRLATSAWPRGSSGTTG